MENVAWEIVSLAHGLGVYSFTIFDGLFNMHALHQLALYFTASRNFKDHMCVNLILP